MVNPELLRRRFLLACLTLSVISGATIAGVPGFGIPRAFANPIPPCSNAACHGWDRCLYWSGLGCAFTGDSCITSKC